MNRIWAFCLLFIVVPASYLNGQPIIETFAGKNIHSFYNGSATGNIQFNLQHKIKVLPTGKLYIADAGNNCVRILDLTTGATTIYAGKGAGTFSGDGSTASTAELNYPQSISVASTGDIFIADCWNHRIRKVNTSGTISTVAGNGTPGFSGDGFLATSAQMNKPQSVALDNAGNIYIADYLNNCIRMVDGSGLITTIAGNSTVAGYSGDGGPATDAKLNKPMDLYVDTNANVYIVDQGNHAVRMIQATTGNIITLAGTGTPGFSGDGGPATAAQLQNPYAVIWDHTGYVYIADNGNNRVRSIQLSSMTINTVAGDGTPGNAGDGGPATAAQLYAPAGVTMSPTGELYISSGGRVRKVSSGIISTVIGSDGYGGDGGIADSALLQNPMHTCHDIAGNIYIADSGNHTVRKVNTAGIISTVAGTGVPGYTGDGGAATSAKLNQPVSVAISPSGILYIADKAAHVIRAVNTGSGQISTFAGTGAPGFSGDGGSATLASLNNPWGIALDTSGDLAVSDNGNDRIRAINIASGMIFTIAGSGTPGFSGDGSLASAAQLNSPAYIAFNNTNDLFIADKNNNRIRKITASTGIINTVFGNGTPGDAGDGGLGVDAQLCTPIGVAIDDTGGISTSVCGKIRHVPTGGGPVHIYAGNGLSGLSPEGSLAINTVFDGAAGLSYANTTLLIGDAFNHAVRARNPDASSNITSHETPGSAFKIIPNPVFGSGILSGCISPALQNTLSYSVSDFTGRLIVSGPLNIVDNMVVTQLPGNTEICPGLYFCKIVGKEFNQTIPFIIQK